MFVIGLDLASQQDYTALSILETMREKGKRTHRCGALQRWRETYPDTVAKVAAVAKRPVFRNAVIVADQTGVGRPVVDMLREALPGRRVIGCTITAGSGWSRGEHKDDVRVSKKLLVSTLQVLFAEGRMAYRSGLELVPVLQGELQNFRVKITAHVNETFEAWRDSQHDDLVLSVGLAAFVAENLPAPLTDARVEGLVLNVPALSGRDLAAGEGVRSRMELLAEDHPALFGGERPD